MLEKIKQIFSLPDLRNRIIVVVLLLFVTRILAHIPIPGANLEQLKDFFQKNQIFGLLNMFPGGAMENFSLILMGVGPYITASIIMQLLGIVIPSLEALQKEGEWGQQKINQYTRYLTVPIAIMQSYAMLNLLKSQNLISNLSVQSLILMNLATTAGSILLMWLGELISENGIGNGISLIISVGIIAGFPTQIRNTLATLDTSKIIGLAAFGVLYILVIALIVFINEGERKIPVSYATRSTSMRSYATVQSHLPLRVNAGGVIPIIFGMSMMLVPSVASRFFEQAKSAWLADTARYVSHLFQNNLFYDICYFILVIFFTFFYVGIIFKPKQVAENLQKQGGFIPGIRPGSESSSYISKIVNKITLTGALFLGLIAILPFIVQSVTGINTLVLGGTGLLIIVSVIIETSRQLQAQIAMRTYEKY